MKVKEKEREDNFFQKNIFFIKTKKQIDNTLFLNRLSKDVFQEKWGKEDDTKF